MPLNQRPLTALVPGQQFKLIGEDSRRSYMVVSFDLIELRPPEGKVATVSQATGLVHYMDHDTLVLASSLFPELQETA